MLALDAAFPHTRARAPSLQFEIAECRYQLLLPTLGGVARAVQAVLQQPEHVFVTWLVVLGWQFDKHSSSCWSVEVRPSHVNKCHNLSSTLACGCVDAYNSGLACVLYFSATHLARTLGFRGCPLSVSAHPVLMGAFPVSRRHTSLGTLVCILWRRMYSASSRLASAHSSAYLAFPGSCLFLFLECAARVDTSVSMRARAFTSHPRSNLSRVGDCPYTCFDESWSSFTACDQSKHAQIRHCHSRSGHGHDLRHALHSRDDF